MHRTAPLLWFCCRHHIWCVPCRGRHGPTGSGTAARQQTCRCRLCAVLLSHDAGDLNRAGGLMGWRREHTGIAHSMMIPSSYVPPHLDTAVCASVNLLWVVARHSRALTIPARRCCKLADSRQPAEARHAVPSELRGLTRIAHRCLVALQGTHGFTLDPLLGEFMLTHPDITIPKRGQIYSVNDARYFDWLVIPNSQSVPIDFKKQQTEFGLKTL